MNEPNPLMVGLQALGWDARRVAAALSVAAPNDVRIAQAALQRLTPQDHGGTFAAWCDAQAGCRDE